MAYYLSDSWQICTSAAETISGDRYGVTRNDVFQLAGSDSGTVGGVNNNWDSFNGGAGWDRIYVAPKSGYSWTAIMLQNDGLHNVEAIDFTSSNTEKPIYFLGSIDFSDVVSMTAGVKIFGRAGDDTFHGGSLGEWAEGDAGNDTLYGNGGNDTLYGDTAANPWAVSWTAAGNDNLYGGSGNDILHGQSGNDSLFGGADNDQVYGEDGSDLLDGGAGVNDLWGGNGSDTFQFTSTSEESTIHDFVVGTDRLRFDTGIADEFTDLAIANNINGDAEIAVGGVTIILVGVSATSITGADVDFGAYA